MARQDVPPSDPLDASASALSTRPPLFVPRLPVESNGRSRIKRVFIANRGEIACRIIATCRRLELTSIAVYANEDALSRHVSDADEAICFGSIDQEGQNPFLNVRLLVDTALSAEADAVHPGYGYLSENGEFADAVRQAGLIFIGPSVKAMSTLGHKRSSKEYLQRHAPSVPLIPGFAGSSQDVRDLEAAAESIGFPVMLKASAGGGGRGMRIVYERSKLKEELQRVQSEAARSFGSGDCILEKYIEAGKHIEVQIVGDSHGKVLSLWERECSVQRRHQKVIEETPSPWMTPQKRQQMSAAAVQIGELLGYEGAGTVEFVVDVKDGSFYFLEVNTRLQVEHPITEETTGLDIVALQLFAAAGGSFASVPILRQIPQHGHAIECRLCAEDPHREFMPEHGSIRLWKPSYHHQTDSRDVRFETAVRTGVNVSIYFDSMIAKMVVWAPTRPLAIEKMVNVLAHTVCMGIRTNQLFLQACLLHEEFQNPAYTTSFISRNMSTLIHNPHLHRAPDLGSMLSLVPCLILRDSGDRLSSSTANRPFGHVRRGFRSQPFDRVNRDVSIVWPTDPAHPKTPLICVWKPSRTATGHNQRVYLTALPAVNTLDKDHQAKAKRSAAYEITARYNEISNSLRNGETGNAAEYEVELKTCNLDTVQSSSPEPWKAGSAEVTINGSKIAVNVALEAAAHASVSAGITGMGETQRVLCHFATLGTWIEYRCYNLLTFCESIRETAVDANSSQLKSVKAPMPCKVLSVLKKNGDDVKPGEIVLVIESMKMEMNISMDVGGKFGTTVSKGDAIDDGKVLCWVD